MIDTLKKLRKELHQNPELSGEESATAQRIQSFIELHHPTEIINKLGGHGLAAIYKFSTEGPTIAIRCELDALPIEEENDFLHQSNIKDVSHKCGHDGQMTIVAGLIFWIKQQDFKAGKIILLFQSAEETGKGAYQMLQDERFSKLNIDYIFALHNIPGEQMHSVITMEHGFSAEVQSFSVKLKGLESHASEPENGINPAIGISEIINKLSKLNLNKPEDIDFAVLTPVHINMGQKSYGISPANGELHYTIRTWSTEKMLILESEIEKAINQICGSRQLEYKIDWFEHFPASQNNKDCNTIIKKAAKINGIKTIQRPYPFKFGEDFGWFTKEYKTSMFGLGAGEKTPALHNAEYDFPDELIETGINMFGSIISMIIQK